MWVHVKQVHVTILVMLFRKPGGMWEENDECGLYVMVYLLELNSVKL